MLSEGQSMIPGKLRNKLSYRSNLALSLALTGSLAAACSGNLETQGQQTAVGTVEPGFGAGSLSNPSGPTNQGTPGVPSVPSPGATVVNVDNCNSASPPLSAQLRRLSETQVRNSIVDIFGDIFPDELWPQFEDGARLLGMNTLADTLQVNSINLERHYDAVRGIVQTLLRSHGEFQACAQDQQSACVDAMIESYGRRIWRRPLTLDERNRFSNAHQTYDDNESKLEFAFNVLLVGSDFLFRSETGGIAAQAGGERSLDNYEVASFLSYAVWNSTPDDALLDLASQDAGLGAEQLTQTLDRMLADPRANTALVELYKDYLKLDLVLKREKDEVLGFTSAARDDLLRSVELTLGSRIGSDVPLMSVFGGSTYFMNNATASFFNEQVAQSEFSPVDTNANERDGVLNHPAFLSVHSTRSSSGIVQRGVFTLEQLLCQHLPDPPDDISTAEPPPGLDPERTSERELLTITHSSKPECLGCHQFIDPAGFGFEHFDAAGRYRTTEKQDVAIDATGELAGVGSYTTSAEFSRALVASERMKACVTQRFLEHYMGQELESNSCALQRYRALLANEEDSVYGLLRALVQLPSFLSRNQSEVNQ